ncbi:glycosyl transferase [Streptococcus pneumoniae]|uniref:glycosyltransferase family 4 protein n=1 Tax=Streptococcus pneumoniae TaxID=1313 RepID=UPI0017565E8B|nr:glycosyltransferase family 4 protein [Streptococcus pneumoniae]GBO90962.1 glycosyl transferase [Streptococcus pneumoniae]
MNLQKKKIMLITNHDDDIYCFRKEVIESLVEYGYEVLVSCPYGDKIELMKSIQFEYEDITIDRRGINPLKDIRLFLSYIRLLRKYRPDVVLTYTVKPNVYASLAATILGIKYINNVTGLGSVLTMGSCVRSLVLLLFRISFRKSNCVFFQNEYNMKMLKTLGLILGDSKLIPGSGVNIEKYPVQQYPNGGNGIQGETIVFNFIGRILKEKGIDTYLAAAQIIKSRYPKTEFNIIGFIEPTESNYELKICDLEKKRNRLLFGTTKRCDTSYYPFPCNYPSQCVW